MSKFLSVAGYTLTTVIAGGIFAAWLGTSAPGTMLLLLIALAVGALVATAIALYFDGAPIIAGGVIMGIVGAIVVTLASLNLGEAPLLIGLIFMTTIFAITGVVSGLIYRAAGLIGAPKGNQMIGD